MLNCQLVENYGNFWLTSLITLISAFFRKAKYYFSYFSQYSFSVLCSSSYLGDFLKLSQLVNPNQLFLPSESCLMILRMCLNSTRQILPLFKGLRGMQLLFSIMQYMNRQQLSWHVRTSQFFTYNLESNFFQEELLLDFRLLLPQDFASTILFFEFVLAYTLGTDFCQFLDFFLLTRYYLSTLLVCDGYYLVFFPTENSLPFLSVYASFGTSLKLMRLLKLFMFNQRNSSLDIRSSLLTAHILESRNLMCELTLNFYGTLKGVVVIFLRSYFSLLHSQGVTPIIISQRMTPTEKMSLSGEQTFLIRDSMGMYKGVPTLCLVLIQQVLLIENPKSPSFHDLECLKMLAGLMSLWITPILRRYLVAYMTSVMMKMASFSHNFPLLVIYSRRSPCGQYSVMRQQCVAVLYTFSNLIMLGWLSFFRIYIQLSSIQRLDAEYFLSSITLIAYSPYLSWLLHRQT